MADRTILERLQPSLLDRLTDDEPHRQSEGREARVIDIRRLREIVRRDLAWLLNTTNLDSQIDAELYPNVRRSVVNYGIDPVAGDSSTLRRADAIRAAIRRSVEMFEPRIRTGSVDVTMREDDSDRSVTSIFFDIRADMWAQPLPLELYLQSEVDLTTGHVSLERRG
ncbi:type VI secretion system baseplate subunit TssE [Tropicimonas sp.]|uniref:type VI secretion system baseplate subunit TssE n=1 Tax=Tropicimonas sp. TaxID=2067044 RepID=UPI003A861181